MPPSAGGATLLPGGGGELSLAPSGALAVVCESLSLASAPPSLAAAVVPLFCAAPPPNAADLVAVLRGVPDQLAALVPWVDPSEVREVLEPLPGLALYAAQCLGFGDGGGAGSAHGGALGSNSLSIGAGGVGAGERELGAGVDHLSVGGPPEDVRERVAGAGEPVAMCHDVVGIVRALLQEIMHAHGGEGGESADAGRGGRGGGEGAAPSSSSELLRCCTVFALAWGLGGTMAPRARGRLCAVVRKAYADLGVLMPFPRDAATGEALSLFDVRLCATRAALVRWSDGLPGAVGGLREWPLGSNDDTVPVRGFGVPGNSVLVPSAALEAAMTVLELVCGAGQGVMVLGTASSGKSALLGAMLAAVPEQRYVRAGLALTAGTPAARLREAVEGALCRQRRGLLCAPLGKRALFVVDDLHAPMAAHEAWAHTIASAAGCQLPAATPPFSAMAADTAAGKDEWRLDTGARAAARAGEALPAAPEWLRQVADSGGFYDAAAGCFTATPMVQVLAAGRPGSALRSPAASRLLRHLFLLRVEGSAEGDARILEGVVARLDLEEALGRCAVALLRAMPRALYAPPPPPPAAPWLASPGGGGGSTTAEAAPCDAVDETAGAAAARAMALPLLARALAAVACVYDPAAGVSQLRLFVHEARGELRGALPMVGPLGGEPRLVLDRELRAAAGAVVSDPAYAAAKSHARLRGRPGVRAFAAIEAPWAHAADGVVLVPAACIDPSANDFRRARYVAVAQAGGAPRPLLAAAARAAEAGALRCAGAPTGALNDLAGGAPTCGYAGAFTRLCRLLHVLRRPKPLGHAAVVHAGGGGGGAAARQLARLAAFLARGDDGAMACEVALQGASEDDGTSSDCLIAEDAAAVATMKSQMRRAVDAATNTGDGINALIVDAGGVMTDACSEALSEALHAASPASLRIIVVLSERGLRELRQQAPTLASMLTAVTLADPGAADVEDWCHSRVEQLAADAPVSSRALVMLNTTTVVDAKDAVQQRFSDDLSAAALFAADTIGDRTRHLAAAATAVHTAACDILGREFGDMHGPLGLAPTSSPEAARLCAALVERAHAIERDAFRTLGHAAARAHSATRILGTARAALKLKRARVAALVPDLEAALEGCVDGTMGLAHQAAHADTLQSKIADAERAAGGTEIAAVMEETRAAQEEAEASRLLCLAADNLGVMAKDDLAEMRSYITPPRLVRTVVEAVCVALGGPTDWEQAKTFLLTGDEASLRARLLSFDIRRLGVAPGVLGERLKRFTSAKSFTPNAVAQVSRAARSLCEWILDIVKYLAQQEVAVLAAHRASMARKNAERREAEVALCQRAYEGLEGSVKSLRGAYEASLSIRAGLEVALAETRAEVDALEAVVRALTCGEENDAPENELVDSAAAAWSRTLAACAFALQRARGHALLAAATAVYLAPLPPARRILARTKIAAAVRARGMDCDGLLHAVSDGAQNLWSASALEHVESIGDMPTSELVRLAGQRILLCDPESKVAPEALMGSEAKVVRLHDPAARSRVREAATIGRSVVVLAHCGPGPRYVADALARADELDNVIAEARQRAGHSVVCGSAQTIVVVRCGTERLPPAAWGSWAVVHAGDIDITAVGALSASYVSEEEATLTDAGIALTDLVAKAGQQPWQDADFVRAVTAEGRAFTSLRRRFKKEAAAAANEVAGQRATSVGPSTAATLVLCKRYDNVLGAIRAIASEAVNSPRRVVEVSLGSALGITPEQALGRHRQSDMWLALTDAHTEPERLPRLAELLDGIVCAGGAEAGAAPKGFRLFITADVDASDCLPALLVRRCEVLRFVDGALVPDARPASACDHAGATSRQRTAVKAALAPPSTFDAIIARLASCREGVVDAMLLLDPGLSPDISSWMGAAATHDVRSLAVLIATAREDVARCLAAVAAPPEAAGAAAAALGLDAARDVPRGPAPSLAAADRALFTALAEGSVPWRWAEMLPCTPFDGGPACDDDTPLARWFQVLDAAIDAVAALARAAADGSAHGHGGAPVPLGALPRPVAAAHAMLRSASARLRAELGHEAVGRLELIARVPLLDPAENDVGAALLVDCVTVRGGSWADLGLPGFDPADDNDAGAPPPMLELAAVEKGDEAEEEERGVPVVVERCGARAEQVIARFVPPDMPGFETPAGLAIVLLAE